MDTDDESQDCDPEPTIYGLGAYDWDYQYAQCAAAFGLELPPSYGPVRPVSNRELNWIVFKATLYANITLYAFHAMWQTLLCWILMELTCSIYSLPFPHYEWTPVSLSAVLVHLCLFVCTSPGCCKELVLGMLRYFAGRREHTPRVVNDDMEIIQVLTYCVACMTYHNVRTILRTMFKPRVLLLLGLICTLWIARRPHMARLRQSVIAAIHDRIWITISNSRHRFYAVQRRYTNCNSSQDATGQYQYGRLAPSETRLLELRRAHVFAKLTFSLKTCPLATAPSYYALSYTWGNSLKPHSLVVGNRLVAVTENAFQALHALAPVWGTRLIWIDSICIYLGQHRTKYCRNLRFEPLFCEGVGFAHLASLELVRDLLQSGARL
jgi:hypothetical protein